LKGFTRLYDFSVGFAQFSNTGEILAPRIAPWAFEDVEVCFEWFTNSVFWYGSADRFAALRRPSHAPRVAAGA
jgi:hypothetical protein